MDNTEHHVKTYPSWDKVGAMDTYVYTTASWKDCSNMTKPSFKINYWNMGKGVAKGGPDCIEPPWKREIGPDSWMNHCWDAKESPEHSNVTKNGMFVETKK